MKVPFLCIVLLAAALVTSCGSTQSAGNDGGGATGGSNSGRGGSGGGAGGGGGQSGSIACTIDGGQCPSGYRCGCGGPGIGQCSCYKECNTANDCTAPNTMCGCSSSDPAPRICVNACFCLCG